jgi:hypothetical protein
MKYRDLPISANLETIKKEARKLLHALRQNDAATAERYRLYDLLESNSDVRLPDAQYVIARHYGFKSWANLLKNLNARRANTASKFLVTA